jgi:hypothetical protein
MHDVIGKRFAEALAQKDRAGLLALLDPDLDFRALTPGRFWEASSAETLVDDIILGTWFDPGDHIEELEDVEVGSVADRDRVSYRLRITNSEGTFLVEQQAYFGVEDDHIGLLRVMCSGYRPIGGPEQQ